MEALVKKYRPQTFSRVFGQEYPVRILSQLIKRGRVCRNLLLHGSVGSGKTTLARIYGKALNCVCPDEKDGSPCLRCPSCENFDEDDGFLFNEIDAPLLNNVDKFKEDVNKLLIDPPSDDHRRLIFVDEAHAIRDLEGGGGFEFLLKIVEEAHPRIAFCFATTELDRISKALRSRLFQLEIRPLGLEQGITFLRTIADEEKIQCEPEALTLLAGLGQGLPRNLLQALDQVREVGDVTREQVREIFGIDQTELLVEYFMELATGSFARQTQVISAWNESMKEKLRFVQLFLLSLYYNNLLGVHLIVDPIVDSITEVERQPILQEFKTRLAMTDAELPRFWQGMIESLPISSLDQSEEALLIRLTLFQRLVTDGPASMASDQNAAPASGVHVTPRRSASKKPGPKRRRRSRPTAVQNPAYLAFDDVRDLFNAASFLLQQYGPVYFNTRITVPFRLFKFSDGKDEVFISDFYRALRYFFVRLPSSEFHRLSVLEHDAQLGLCARIIIHVPNKPADADDRLRKWIFDWRADRRSNVSQALNIQIEGKRRLSSTRRSVSYHWQCVRWLCAGVDPSDERVRELKWNKAQRRRAGVIGNRRRFSRSDSLGPTKIGEASQLKMEFLSAFNDEAWDHLENGWELHEHSNRRTELQKRKSQVERIAAKFPKANDGRRKSELARLEHSWPGKYAWPRSWERWWNNE